jgi:transposase-like protein
MKKTPDSIREAVLARVRDGQNITSAAHASGVKPRTAYDWVIAAGIKTRRRLRVMTIQESLGIAQSLTRGMPATDAAKKHGVSMSSVRAAAKRHGVALRRQGWALDDTRTAAHAARRLLLAAGYKWTGIEWSPP